MSGSSKKSARKRSGAIDRPFDPRVLARASALAAQYKILLEPDAEAGFAGRALEMPECVGVGKTADQCVSATRDVLTSGIATMLEAGDVPPMPSAQGLRQQQINIRVTPEEKLMLEEAARSKGFRGISDFVRSATFASLGR